jgi:hypothetical protein
LCGTLEEQKQATTTAKAIFCRCALWASLRPSAKRKAAGQAGLNARAYLNSKDNSNSRSLRDDKQERQNKYRGFFASLRMTTLAGGWRCGRWLRTTCQGELCYRCTRRGREPLPRLLCVEEMCQRSDEGLVMETLVKDRTNFVSGRVRCVAYHLRLRMCDLFLAVGLEAPFFFFFFLPGWATGLMVVMTFAAMGEPRPEQASQPGPALKPTGVPV